MSHCNFEDRLLIKTTKLLISLHKIQKLYSFDNINNFYFS